ncbi:MAG: DegV family EDD domain-containing protein [Lachnospiraceae bacterium]|nr:DegV family EDD domain-containing protein [Lachnospiraceae bacterium]
MKIIADSSCDMAVLPGMEFSTVPLIISTDEREFVDGESLNVDEMLTFIEHYKGRTGTACPSIQGFLEALGDAKEAFIVTMTGALSGTYGSACAAKDQYIQEHPEAKVYVIDSRSTGPGLRLLLEKLAEMHEKGLVFEEMCRRIEEYKATNRLYFGLKSIDNLAKSGRINKLIASAVGLLGISILGTASPEGTIEPVSKSRGDRGLVKDTIKAMKAAGYRGGKVRINNVLNPAISEALRSAIVSEFPNADVLCYQAYGLNSFYAERNGFILGCEC